MRRYGWLTVLAGLSILSGCGGGDSVKPADDGPLPLEHYDAGFFSFEKPRGWTVVVAGHCSLLAWLARDPQDPRRQIFYFGEVGPVYTSQAQKDLDAWYVSQGGFNIPWLDAPVVDPLTPENYLSRWPEIAAMAAADDFMPQFPHLDGLTLIATTPQAAMLPGASTAIARGLFHVGDEAAEGMFLATVKEFMPYVGTPGGGTAYGNMICGVTASKADFPALASKMVQSLNSFSITQAYVDQCLAEQQELWGAVEEAGQTLREASDIIYDGWESRTHGEDITAEQWTDAFRGVERVYDPGTGEVYEFPAGWYDAYNVNRDQYEMSGLQLLPADDYGLWMHPVLDGEGRIH